MSDTKAFRCNKCNARITTVDDIAGQIHLSDLCGGIMYPEQLDVTNPKDLIGIKKPQLNLVPAALMIHTARAMENGAAKYGPYNWRQKKVKLSVYLGAAMRHILAYQDGEENAADSGVHHLAHAAACLGIILDAAACDALIDDRVADGPAAKLIEQFTKK